MATQMGKYLKPLDFFARNPVFRYEEFKSAYMKAGNRSRQTCDAALKQHVAAGNLLRVRQGIYVTVPHGFEPESTSVDQYLLCSKLTKDAIVSHHTALEFYGKAYSVWHRFHYTTSLRLKPFFFREMELAPVQAPAEIRYLADLGGEVKEQPYNGGMLRVATLERTLVDVLYAPHLCGGWEEIWRCLEMIEFFNIEAVTAYTEKLKSAITAARVGFFLEQNRERLMIEESYLKALKSLAPSQPRYFDAKRESGKLVAQWNIIVPEYIMNKGWEEVS